jgi:hypothetical protein
MLDWLDWCALAAGMALYWRARVIRAETERSLRAALATLRAGFEAGVNGAP